jgi:uncharacterized RDD family membrane protein YckC
VAPISPVPREARPYQGEHAGLVTRVLANTVDALVCAAALLIGYLGLNALRFVVNPRSFHLSEPRLLFSLVAASVLFAVYTAAAWAITGRTYGCHVMGLRVVGRDGGRVRPIVAILRAALCVVLPIGLFLCAGGRSRRSLADLALRTSVIYDWSPRPAPEPAALDEPGGDGATDATDATGRAWGHRGALDT